MKKYWKCGKRVFGVLMAAWLMMLSVGCSAEDAELVGNVVELLVEVAADNETQATGGEAQEANSETQASDSKAQEDKSSGLSTPQSQESDSTIEYAALLPQEGEYYYDVENVVLYLYLYEELPDNYMTKSEARKLGWEGGSVERYEEGAAIGGDTFGNREGLLPEKNGRTYTECDIDTLGEDSRGAKRLVFSSDGLYFYTEDHYESFDEVIVTEAYEVEW